jgi:hypothetical protein
MALIFSDTIFFFLSLSPFTFALCTPVQHIHGEMHDVRGALLFVFDLLTHEFALHCISFHNNNNFGQKYFKKMSQFIQGDLVRQLLSLSNR